MYIQRHTSTSTHVQSAHTERNGNKQAQEPGSEGRKKGFVRDLEQTPKQKKPDIHESKEKSQRVVDLGRVGGWLTE